MEYNELVDKIGEIVKGRNRIADRALPHYREQVHYLTKLPDLNRREVELCLEYMLDLCFDERILTLYRRLCRYYYDFDPESAARYVWYYVEMWDEDQERFGQKSGTV